MIENTILTEKANRLAFMRALYEATNGTEFVALDQDEVGSTIGFAPESTERVVHYLLREGLISGYLGGGVSITHDGINEVEYAVSHPDRPTEHFPAINFISIGTMNNSQIAQGSPSATQTHHLSLGQDDIDEVRSFIEEYRRNLTELKFRDEQLRDAEADLQTLESQLSSSKPKMQILKSAGESLRDLLTHAGGILVAEQL